MKKLYVAYGSNLNKIQMRFRCPHAVPYGSGVLKDYELLFKGSKSGYYATVEPKNGSEVPVGLWLIDWSDEYNLDLYEGYPQFYYKTVVDVELTNGETVNAMVYIMHENRNFGIPNERYVQTCLDGYDDFDLDKLVFLDAYFSSFNKERM